MWINDQINVKGNKYPLHT